MISRKVGNQAENPASQLKPWVIWLWCNGKNTIQQHFICAFLPDPPCGRTRKCSFSWFPLYPLPVYVEQRIYIYNTRIYRLKMWEQGPLSVSIDSDRLIMSRYLNDYCSWSSSQSESTVGLTGQNMSKFYLSKVMIPFWVLLIELWNVGLINFPPVYDFLRRTSPNEDVIVGPPGYQ